MHPRLALLIMLIGWQFAFAGEVIDEVVAVVGTTPILASDVRLAEMVALIPDDPAATAAEMFARRLDARIRLEMHFRDLESSAILYRLDLEVDRRLESLLARCGPPEGVGARLAGIGMRRGDLAELALRIEAVQAYVEQRLRPRVGVGIAELEAAYLEIVVDPVTARGATPPPLVEVRDELRRVVVERRLNEEIELWTQQARERLPVTRLRR